MKKLLLVLASTGLIITNAGATLLFSDGFDYTSGQLLAPNNDTTGSPNPGLLNIAYSVNWRYAGGGNATTQTPPGIAGNGLSYDGLLASAGNSVTFDSADAGTARRVRGPIPILSRASAR